MPSSENCEHGFYRSRGCAMCAERVAAFKKMIAAPQCQCVTFEPSENPDRCPVHGYRSERGAE